MAVPTASIETTVAASSRARPYTCVRYGTPQSPRNVMTVVYMPPAVMMGGHVRGFRITSGSAGARCAVWSGLIGASPIASGWSRMQPAATAANTRVTPPITTNVSRHPTASTRSASGEAARRAPTLPTVWVQPEMVANSSERNHAAARLSHAISMTDAPSPTRSRPAYATPNVGASPKSAAPSPIVTPPSAIVQRGPSVSARLPATSAIAANTYG